MKNIEERYADRSDVVIEADFSKPSTMNASDILVTDWSGIACEFSFTTKRPCIFIDTPMKVINPDYEKTGLIPTEISLRNLIGRSFSMANIRGSGSVVTDMLSNPEKYAAEIENVLQTMYFNPGHAGEVAGKYILESLIEKKQNKTKP